MIVHHGLWINTIPTCSNLILALVLRICNLGILLLLLPLWISWLYTLLNVLLLRDISNYWVRHWQLSAILIEIRIPVILLNRNHLNYFLSLLILVCSASTYAADNTNSYDDQEENYNRCDYSRWCWFLLSYLSETVSILWVTNRIIHISVVGIPVVVGVHVTAKVHVIRVNVNGGASVIATIPAIPAVPPIWRSWDRNAGTATAATTPTSR